MLWICSSPHRTTSYASCTAPLSMQFTLISMIGFYVFRLWGGGEMREFLYHCFYFPFDTRVVILCTNVSSVSIYSRKGLRSCLEGCCYSFLSIHVLLSASAVSRVGCSSFWFWEGLRDCLQRCCYSPSTHVEQKRGRGWELSEEKAARR